MTVRRVAAFAAALFLAAPLAGQDPPAWTRAVAPFHVVGPISYVGSEGLGAYLIRTSRGLILIDAPMAENAALIERNIRALGHRLADVKLLLVTHAHFDHAGGLAHLKRDTGARLLASAADAPALATGTPPSETSYGIVRFPAVDVDAAVVEGRPVRLGDVSLMPILTPGHTPGCTSWTLTVRDHGRPLRVIFPCSLTIAGNKLIGNRGYPTIIADFRRSFTRLETVDADVVLPMHSEQADLIPRSRRAAAGARDAFLMPGLLRRLIADARAAFDTELAKERVKER